MEIIIFEDSGFSSLYPLTYLHPSFDLKCGALTFKERIELKLGNEHKYSLLCRDVIAPYVKELYPHNKVNDFSELSGNVLLINGRVLFKNDSLEKLLVTSEEPEFYTVNETLVAAYIPRETAAGFLKAFNYEANDFKRSSGNWVELNPAEYDVINYPWDLIKHLDYALRNDLDLLKDNALTLHKERFSGAVLDDSCGKILIEEGSIIEPFVYMKGPVYIGKDCTVKSGSRLYGPVSVGEHSKISGEISSTIFRAYCNKQHDGFIGHSYISDFVNLGADTVTSNLKNNYSPITMIIDGNEIDTGMQFLGSIIGDHSKTGINTMFNTNTIAGIFSNIVGGNFPKKTIPSFSWVITGSGVKDYDINKAIDTARIVMKRRDVNMSEVYENLVRRSAGS
jgi:UDP-N-acetylglucosamine diphosphorylase/glucosamine-1-phosphate N-acetyltransferase